MPSSGHMPTCFKYGYFENWHTGMLDFKMINDPIGILTAVFILYTTCKGKKYCSVVCFAKTWGTFFTLLEDDKRLQPVVLCRVDWCETCSGRRGGMFVASLSATSPFLDTRCFPSVFFH